MHPSVLLQQRYLPEYRIPLLHELSKQINLTVVHSSPKLHETDLPFKTIYRPIFSIGPFLHHCYLDLVSNYDVLITEANLRYLISNLRHSFLPRKYKWIPWGIGVSASYTRNFGEKRSFEFLRYSLFRNSDALLFYSHLPVNSYIKNKFRPETLFVANNTVCLVPSSSCPDKSHFLFLGTLHKCKRIVDVLKEYLNYADRVKNPIPFFVVGGGDDLQSAINFTAKYGLSKNIFFYGPIYDETKLASLISCSLCCVSPHQAGLSVLKSFGYGTAFVTRNNAITGGEISNIKHGFNGILMDDSSSLADIFLDAHKFPERYCQMGENARHTYMHHASPNQFVESFVNAINT